ncbi:MAG: putative membrane protein YeaQ/YmgE (transglycosylase-associated protein family) [Loktanella salsilacus]|jgi:uncharacterized membrane protein YeaQ/YmgE (transglycosylase-associated protein family)
METVMETFFEVVGWGALTFLAIIGLVAGLIASAVTGGNRAAYVIAGILGAVALPFVLALLGVTAAIGASLIAILVMGIIGAVLLVVLFKALTGRADTPRR